MPPLHGACFEQVVAGTMLGKPSGQLLGAPPRQASGGVQWKRLNKILSSFWVMVLNWTFEARAVRTESSADG